MALSDLYYFAKPAIPLRVRLAFRRVLANYLRRRYADVWPINEVAGRVPARWSGWPEGKQFAFVLTHDVEGTKGMNRCQELAELEMAHGFRSAFNFVPEGEYRVPDSLRGFLNTNGFEVGVHDLHHDGSLYRSRETFKAGVEKINRYIKQWGAAGFRSGFMRHNLEWLGELDVLYDSSTFDTDPLEPQPDGVDTIFPFWVSQDGVHGYVEMPYTLSQDSTLFLLLKETSIDIWKRKLDWVAQKGGLALVGVHPDYLSFNGQKQLGEYSHQLYLNLLAYVKDRYADQCWFALPKEVAQYFYASMVAGVGVTKSVAMQEGKESAFLSQSSPPKKPSSHDMVVSPAVIGSKSASLAGMRMAVVSYSNFPGDPRPRRAAETFMQAGMAVEVICLMDEGSPKRDTFKGIEVCRIPMKHVRSSKFGYGFRYGLFILIAFGKLAVQSLTKRYDIVHIHNMPDILVLAALVPKCLGAKVILDQHDPMPELMMTIFKVPNESYAVRVMALLEKWSIAFADAVITVNRACERLFISRGCPPSKISVVMNTPDEKIFRSVPPKMSGREVAGRHAPFIIMYHGTLVERNGVDLAVDALDQICRSVANAELRIYGPRTPFLDQVLLDVGNRGLEKAVHYLGPRRLEQLVEAIEECDVGVIPNKQSIFTELNTPTRIFEYLALGKPVVAPRAPGIQDYFAEDSLVFFELGNVEDLARKLIWTAHHPKEVFDITTRGQTVYLAHSWSKEQEKLVSRATALLSEGSTTI